MDNLLERSAAFEAAMSAMIGGPEISVFENSPRALACAGACTLSIEHAATLRIAFAAFAPNSGTALLRLQYEALLRGAWALYAATDAQLTKLDQPLDSEAAHGAKNLPGALEMLESLRPRVPTGLFEPLRQFRLVSWGALNSFVHSGIHPLKRTADGFPKLLAAQIIQNSNGVMHLTYRLLAIVMGRQDLLHRITAAYRSFEDCLPAVRHDNA